jgi:lysophospholipid acyltransferase (LPLAT)-like uncharacterized protein
VFTSSFGSELSSRNNSFDKTIFPLEWEFKQESINETMLFQVFKESKKDKKDVKLEEERDYLNLANNSKKMIKE